MGIRRTEPGEAWEGLDEDPPDGPVTNESLLLELRRARLAYRSLRESLERSRAATWAWRTLAVLIALLAFLGWRQGNRADNRFEDMARSIFVTNCDASNANLAADNTRDVEAAERLGRFALDLNVDPEVVAAYLDETKDAAEARQPRDCTAEYDQLPH